MSTVAGNKGNLKNRTEIATKLRNQLLPLVEKYDKLANSIGDPTYINTIGMDTFAWTNAGELENKKAANVEKQWFSHQMKIAVEMKKNSNDLKQSSIAAKNARVKSDAQNKMLSAITNGSKNSWNMAGGGFLAGQGDPLNFQNLYTAPTFKAVHGRWDEEDYGVGPIETGNMWVRYPNGVVKERGSKSWRHNNPGNITGMGGKLLFGAIGIAKSNTGDKGDRAQLVFSSTQAGFDAMRALMIKRYSDGPIVSEFREYQTDMVSFGKKIRDVAAHGISTSQVFSQLSKEEQDTFMKIWAKWEGYKPGNFGGTRNSARQVTSASGIAGSSRGAQNSSNGYTGNYSPSMSGPTSIAGAQTYDIKGYSGPEDASKIVVEDVIILSGSALTKGGFDKLNATFRNNVLLMAQEYKTHTNKKLKINSAYRDPVHQAALFRKALARYGSVSAARQWVAPAPGQVPGAKGSFHNKGLAIDVDIQPGKRSPQGDELERMGLLKKYRMHRRMRREPWHIEPIESKSMTDGKTADIQPATNQKIEPSAIDGISETFGATYGTATTTGTSPLGQFMSPYTSQQQMKGNIDALNNVVSNIKPSVINTNKTEKKPKASLNDVSVL